MSKTKTNMLKAKRALFGYSQTDVAQKLNTSIITYGKKERGDLDFTQSDLYILKELLALSNDEFCEIFLT